MHDNNYLTDIEGEQNAPRYTPRPFPTPIPAARWDDDPAYCVRINDAWISHIIGALELLDQRDTWIGTADEIADARNQVNEIILAFMDKKACDEMACCPEPTDRRLNANGTVDVSYDGGITWQPDPTDPRPLIPVLPPIVVPGSDKTKCDAATNGLEHLKDKEKEAYQEIVTRSSVTQVAIAIIELVIGVSVAPELIAVWFPIAIALAQAVVGHTAADFDALFTAEVWDAVLCILYCNIGDNGQFNQAGFNSVVAQCNTKIPGGHGDFSAAAHIRSYIRMWGLNRLNNECSHGNAADADCASCECDNCTDNFQIFDDIGIELERGSDDGGNFVRIRSVHRDDFGGQAIMLRTDDDNTCCSLLSTAGSDGGLNYLWNDCGTPRAEPGVVNFTHTGLPPNADAPVNTLGANRTEGLGVFVVKWYFG